MALLCNNIFPHSMAKVVLVMSLWAILIWLYLKKLSMKDIKALPAVLSTKTSMRGKGKSSLAQALFKSIKSTHPNFPILLGYRHYIGYPFNLVYGFDEPHFQLFCDLFLDLKEPFDSHTSQERKWVSMWCCAILGSILGISSLNHTNTSWNSVRIFLRSFFSCSLRIEPILIKHGF